MLNIENKKISEIEVSDRILKLKVNHRLIKNVLSWQLNIAKPRLARTQQRNTIRGSTKKIVPQKKITSLSKHPFLLLYLLCQLFDG